MGPRELKLCGNHNWTLSQWGFKSAFESTIEALNRTLGPKKVLEFAFESTIEAPNRISGRKKGFPNGFKVILSLL